MISLKQLGKTLTVTGVTLCLVSKILENVEVYSMGAMLGYCMREVFINKN